MTKFSRFATLASIIILATPLLALAGTQTVGQSCNDGGDCVAGLVCTGNSTCQASVGGTQPYSGGAGSVNVNFIKGYSTGVISIINDVIVPVLFAVAFLMFVYSVYQYFILGAAEEESRAKGRQFLLWSIVGFAVIFSVWGLVNIVMSTFGLSPGGVAPRLPTL
jgi:hypothetical protein